MKFTHCADLHIGSSRGIPNYLDRQILAMKEVFRLTKEMGHSTVVISGDVAEKDLKLHERDALLKTLLEIDESGDFTTLIISGNHDMHARGYSALRFLEVLYRKNRFKSTHVAVESPAIVTVRGQDFLLFPGFFEGKNINKALKSWIRKCKTPPVVLMHEVIKGAVSDSGFKLEHGVRIEPDLGALYFACGDLHIHQKLHGIPNGFYCGSPCQHDFGEQLPKGFLVVSTKNPTKPKFVEIDTVAPLVTISKAEEIPNVRKDAWIRIQSKSLIGADLPDQVLKIDPIVSAEDNVSTEGISIESLGVVSMKQLKRFLKKKVQLSGLHLQIAMKRAEHYLVQVGSK